MERKVWNVDVDGARHHVALNWTYWSGHRQVVVDGELADSSARPMRWASEQAVDVAGRTAVVRTKPSSRVSPWFVITLEVDGRRVAPEPGALSRWERAA